MLRETGARCGKKALNPCINIPKNQELVDNNLTGTQNPKLGGLPKSDDGWRPAWQHGGMPGSQQIEAIR
jgi:hypothetical protein